MPAARRERCAVSKTSSLATPASENNATRVMPRAAARSPSSSRQPRPKVILDASTVNAVSSPSPVG